MGVIDDDDDAKVETAFFEKGTSNAMLLNPARRFTLRSLNELPACKDGVLLNPTTTTTQCRADKHQRQEQERYEQTKKPLTALDVMMRSIGAW